LPLFAVVLAPAGHVVLVVAASTLLSLGILGAVAARTGGAPVVAGASRVLLWGALAMAATAAIGKLFHVAV
jgi:VIT1/CCC1 family predicted Fe2+/Mn2+ transporter